MQNASVQGKYDIAQIYRRYAPALYRFCWKYVRDRQTALDLRQDVFLKVIKGISSFREESKVSSWIYQIAANHCMDYVRNAKHKNTWVVGEDSVPYECEPTISGMDDRIHLKNDLEPLLKPCSTETRLILRLHCQEGYTQAEVAGVLGCSRGKVGRRIRGFAKKVSQESPALLEPIS